ncbi:hypothetical protein ASZ90_008866 [hydrocarbon metagenome]|uniref:Uncharacterized protein n=1 Tax=hydrocarbon metagenome TaxID=938273 RepID=A0A0W8FKD8_9ZZZZ
MKIGDPVFHLRFRYDLPANLLYRSGIAPCPGPRCRETREHHGASILAAPLSIPASSGFREVLTDAPYGRRAGEGHTAPFTLS